MTAVQATGVSTAGMKTCFYIEQVQIRIDWYPFDS